MCKQKLEILLSEDRIPVKEAFRIQEELASRVVEKNGFKSIDTVAGADISVIKEEKKLLCGIIVFRYPEMEIVERQWEIVEEKFPYIPTLLAFREGPALLRTYDKLKNSPDILIIDGQGLAHPRSFGIACHVGVLLDIPAFGIAKKRLYGEYKEPSYGRGSRTDLVEPGSGRIIGAVVRTRDNVKPVFVSVGHKVELDTAVEITLSCNSGYRIPEPTRQADKYVSELKREIDI